jgi:hypothetical protein
LRNEALVSVREASKTNKRGSQSVTGTGTIAGDSQLFTQFGPPAVNCGLMTALIPGRNRPDLSYAPFPITIAPPCPNLLTKPPTREIDLRSGRT